MSESQETTVAHPRLRRVLKWLLLGVSAVAFFILTGVSMIMLTESGARFAVTTALDRSPLPIVIEGVEGRLAGPLVLRGISVEDQGIEARVEQVVFDWRPLQIVRRRVVIDSVHVTGVDVFIPADYAPPAAEETEESEGPPSVPELPVDVQIHDARIEVTRIVREGVAELGASTVAATGSPDEFQVTVDLHGEAAPVEQFDVTAEVSGAPDAYRLTSDLSFTSAEMPTVTATLRSNGSLTELDVEEATIRTANGEATARARAGWYPEVTWDVSATADGFEVAPFTPEPEAWPGAISFEAETTGRLAEAGPEANIRVDQLSGTLRGQPLEGGLDARVELDALYLERMDLVWGGLQATGEGSFAEALDMTFSVDAPDLGVAVPEASGSVRVEGSVQGPRQTPHLVATFQADEIARDSLGLEAATGSVDVDLAAGGVSEIDVHVLGLRSGSTRVDSVSVLGSGTREAHEIQLGGWMAEERAGVALSGAVLETEGADGPTLAWAGSLDSLIAVTEVAGTWSLDRPADVYASADSVSLGETCLTQLTAGACLQGDRGPDGAALGQVAVTSLPLALLAANAPEGTTVDGTLDAEAQFSLAADGTLSGEGAARTTGGIATAVGPETVQFALEGDGFSFAVDEAGARADADFALVPQVGEGQLELTAEVVLPGYTNVSIAPEDQALEGRVDASSDNLAFLAVLSPLLSDVGGRMNLEAGITGTLAAPEVQGSIGVEDGFADIPELGLELRELTVQGEGDPDGGIELQGSVRSGEGVFELAGRTPTVPTTDDPAELTLTGERFLAIATPEIQVEIGSDLNIGFDGSLTTVEGSVTIPWARVELVEVPESAISPSSDVVFVGEEPVEPPQVDARVQLVVGNDVRFEGLGFTSMFEGDLTIREEPGALPLISGELNLIDGRFAAYGQNLDVDPGRVVFSGPPENATLDVTAERLAQDGTTAGLIVTGSAFDPQIRIFSDPSMSDADALSYIMYGTALSDGDASQQQQVAGAAATLGANVLTTKLAGSVGLDEARIEGTTRDEAELVAGKYLTPSVFVSYGVGLFKPSNTFRIKYLLSSSWALQAESGDANGGDVLYQIERGR